jgi:hypothetical protein
LTKIPTLNSASDVTAYINKVAPNSSMTGEMIMNSASKYNVPANLLVAIAQHESGFGTLGRGARTNNPGNVGNVDSGSNVNWGNWQSGTDALANNIARRDTTSQTSTDALEGSKVITEKESKLKKELNNVATGMNKDLRNSLINSVTKYFNSGDLAAAESMINEAAISKLGVTEKETFDMNERAGQSLSAAFDMLSDSSLSVGPYKALLETKKPYAAIKTDPKYAEFRVLTDFGTAELKRAFFGTAVSANEQNTAGGFLPRPEDDMPTLRSKLAMMPQILKFANDAKLAKAKGLPAPKLTDYLSTARGILNGQSSNQTTDLRSKYAY